TRSRHEARAVSAHKSEIRGVALLAREPGHPRASGAGITPAESDPPAVDGRHARSVRALGAPDRPPYEAARPHLRGERTLDADVQRLTARRDRIESGDAGDLERQRRIGRLLSERVRDAVGRCGPDGGGSL